MDAAFPPYLSPAALDDLIRRALQEDVGDGDVTSLATVPAATRATADFVAKQPGILAGLLVAERVFAAVDPDVEVAWAKRDGEAVAAGERVGTVRGAARSVLTAERLALNLVQRMSGIATMTHRLVEAARPHGAEILDTRKTAPGLRALDKWAVRLGGGTNHRVGLYDMILIKDNHIDAAGGVEAALRRAVAFRDNRAREGKGMQIEVETRTLDEIRAALDAGGADVLLLDNMARRRSDGSVDTSLLRQAVELVRGRVATEASGNVTLHTVAAIAATGVDAISCGALTHSVEALDVSLKVRVEAAARADG